MRHSIMLVMLLVSSGYSQQTKKAAPESRAKHEAYEDKARTVPGGASKGVKACHADLDRWCKEVKPGEGRLGACLMAHAKELSQRCRRWAAHGGKEHMEESLVKDIDGAPPPARK